MCIYCMYKYIYCIYILHAIYYNCGGSAPPSTLLLKNTTRTTKRDKNQ